MPLNAKEAMRGSPSPWNVLAMMPTDARKRESRLRVSVKERLASVEVLIGVCRTTMVVSVKRTATSC